MKFSVCRKTPSYFLFFPSQPDFPVLSVFPVVKHPGNVIVLFCQPKAANTNTEETKR